VKLLLFGADGQVGWELRRSLMPLGAVAALGRKDCDLSRPERAAAAISEFAPDVIVNAAAYTAVDRAEDEEDLAMTLNARAVGIMAEEARRRGALFIHYSTDYVFSGDKQTPYSEDDAPAPVNAYGRSKLAGETAVRDADCDHVVLRTSWVYAARGHNFVNTILRLTRERNELSIVADQTGAPTWTRNIADATALVIAQAGRDRLAGAFSSGVFHLTAAGSTSWHGFAQAILENAVRDGGEGGRQPRLVPIATADYPAKAERPRNSVLCNRRIAERFRVTMPDWAEALRLCLEERAAD
jgi:dTDP-4-dehydrorhamnose reductase